MIVTGNAVHENGKTTFLEYFHYPQVGVFLSSPQIIIILFKSVNLQQSGNPENLSSDFNHALISFVCS
jgi:hypothetical protein